MIDNNEEEGYEKDLTDSHKALKFAVELHEERGKQMHTVKAAQRQEIELPKKRDDDKWQKLTPSSTVIGAPKD